MGQKITIDSASMRNKARSIEASYLFALTPMNRCAGGIRSRSSTHVEFSDRSVSPTRRA